MKRKSVSGTLIPILLFLAASHLGNCKKHSHQPLLLWGELSVSPVSNGAGELRQQSYLKAPNTSTSDQFGASSAISGETIVVGAPYEDSNTTAILQDSALSSTNDAGSDTGAAYVYVRSGGKWTHQAYLKAPNTTNGDHFGNSVSISENTIAVGAPGEDGNTTSIINGNDLSSSNKAGNDNGAVYVFVRNGNTWTHQAYLKAPNTTNQDQFGSSLAVSGETIVVGAPYEDSSTSAIVSGSDLTTTNDVGTDTGAAYVYVRSGSAWTHQAYLKAPNVYNQNYFGNSVAIDGNTITVSARSENSTTTSIISGNDLSITNHSGNGNGAVYVFVRNGANWNHQAYLKSPNASNQDSFGISVAISGDTVVVGADGESSETNAVLTGTDLSSTNRNGSNNGAAYVFVRNGSTWTHQAYLKAPNTNREDRFGGSVSIFGDWIVVGAAGEKSTSKEILSGNDLRSSNRQGFFVGAAYVFTRSKSLWTHKNYLKASNSANGHFFAGSVGISGNTILVGALGESSNTNWIINGTDLSSTNRNGNSNGAAYVFGM
ncbi:hypothetical protein EHO60_03940 [Leptospira fletcheri]|uniref:Integrin n=1 Tax=Leptospira fletcheri TaxID=2484981 RepID=A0A4R9GFU5_9LEPT|nr:hypothetical protein [Leptospira fletcheri]TGK11467.1 hypothetical protein EHO60_03940 [Leptospira fletcheri]